MKVYLTHAHSLIIKLIQVVVTVVAATISFNAMAEPETETTAQNAAETQATEQTEVISTVQVLDIAQDKFVSDRLALQLRSGPSSRNRILKTLRSGTKVSVSQIDTEKGYSLVKTAGGTEGWVLSRFLLNTPTAALQLSSVQQRFDNTLVELNQTKRQLAEVKDELKTLRAERSSQSRQLKTVNAELETIKNISANAIMLDDKAKKLTQRNQELEIQIEALSAENKELSSDVRSSFILYGGGLVIAGILAGIILPSLRKSRNSGGWA